MEKTIKHILAHLMTDVDSWKGDLLRNWPTIMGPLHTKVRLEKIENDALILGVFDSCWLQELYLLSGILLETINQSLDQPRIKQLRFKKVSVQQENIPAKKPKAMPVAPKVVILKEHEKAALNKISDPALGDVLRQFLIRCYQEK